MKLAIRELRDGRQLTQRELAEKIDNVQRNVSNWEKGASEPDCETIVKLADFFEVSIDELFGRESVPYNETHGARDAQLWQRIRNLTVEQKNAVSELLRTFGK